MHTVGEKMMILSSTGPLHFSSMLDCERITFLSLRLLFKYRGKSVRKQELSVLFPTYQNSN